MAWLASSDLRPGALWGPTHGGEGTGLYRELVGVIQHLLHIQLQDPFNTGGGDVSGVLVPTNTWGGGVANSGGQKKS